jgi:UDP-glucose 4-epimerase
VAEHLLRRGHEVAIVDDLSSGKRENVPQDATFYEADIRSGKEIEEIFDGFEPEALSHHAAQMNVRRSVAEPDFDAEVNVVGTLRLLESCVRHGVSKVVFASTGGTVYGVPESVPIHEDHSTNPISSYGIVKLAIEKYLGLFHHLHGLDYAALRISNPYGPYQNPLGQQGAIGVFLHHIHEGAPITIWGDGSVVRDYLYVSDVVDALESAGGETGHRIFNIGSGAGVSLNELLHQIAEVVGEQPEVEYVSGRALDVPASVLDVSRAGEELGWRPRTDLAEGIARTWEWVRSISSSRVEEV